MIDWRKYIDSSYLPDWNAFRTANGGKGRDVNLCDCGAAHIAELIGKAGIREKERFKMALFLEAALLPGVHQYDRQNFSQYCDALPYRIFLRAHAYADPSSGPVLRPQ